MDFTRPDRPAIGSVINGYRTPATCLSYHRDGKRLYVVNPAESRLQVIECFDKGTLDRPALRFEREKIHFVQACHHDDCLLFAGDDPQARHAIHYYSIHDNKILRQFRGHKGRITGISMCPADDTFLSTAAGDATVRLWNVQSAACLAECTVPSSAGSSSSSSSSDNNTSPLAVFDASGLVFGIAAPRDGNNGDHNLHLYDARNYNAGAFAELVVPADAVTQKIQAAGVTPSEAARLAQLPWHGMTFNASGNQILVTAEEGLCLLLDGFEGTVQSALVSPTSSSSAGTTKRPAVACYSGDDQYVLQGRDDGNIDVWKVETASLCKTLEGHNGPVHCLATNPKYAQFASAYRETALWIWD